jgi:uncharacterized protein (DUF885 family)
MTADAAAAHDTPDTADRTPTAGDHLRRLYETEWAWRSAEFGHDQDREGPADHLPDVGPEAQERRRERWEQTLAELATIPRDELTDAERVDFDVYADQLTTLIDQQRFRLFERPATSDNAFWRNLLHMVDGTDLDDADQARAYLSLLADLPRYIGQEIGNMRAGVQRGFGSPAISMRGREEPVRAVAEATGAYLTPFLRPLDTLPEALEPAVRERLREEATAIVDDQVIPAYRELYRFLVEEYLPHLPQSIAAIDLPDGEEFYAAQLREYTTTDLTPRQIFDLGMEEVGKIRAEMEEIAAQVGYPGDLPGLFAFLRTDPQFYATSRRQLLAEAAYTCKSFDRVIHRYFGHLPEQRFAVVPTPKEIEAFDTFGRGGTDRFFVNTYDLPSRPLYSLPALTLHESAPGHCLQLSLAEELDLPEFRGQYISAFGEGWGLYCERLGVEMGMYETPYEMIGMLSFQMWRAVRLVVDTGMHAFGWTREQAQDFLRENTAIAEHEITTEIDRYISWPGQAAAYYLGMLTIQRCRREAAQELGSDFDIRAFHDLVLSLGSVPLSVLESEVRRFIRER